jgi:hypothetical protein
MVEGPDARTTPARTEHPRAALPRYVTVTDPATGLRRVQRGPAPTRPPLPGRGPRAAPTGADSHAWLFQASPRYFRLPEHLRAYDATWWRLTRFFNPERKHVSVGDVVYVYQCGPDAPGLYAVGVIASHPEPGGPPLEDRPDWSAEGQALAAKAPYSVRVAYRTKLGEAYLPRALLQAHPVLRGLTIFTPGAAQGTNHALTEAQADALAALVQQAANAAPSSAP